MPIGNYTTKVPVSRTISEISDLLVRYGVSAIQTQYANKQAVGLSFKLETPLGPATYILPARMEGVQKRLAKAEGAKELKSNWGRGGFATPEQARRVAWRHLRDWVAAQMDLIANEMATIDEIFLPFQQVAGGGSLYRAYLEKQLGPLGLPSPREED